MRALQPAPPDVPDALLVGRVRAGEGEALGQLYDRYAGALFALAARLLDAREDAEDLLHDVFVGLPEALRHYQEQGKLGAWLKRLTVRAALNERRARDRNRERALAVGRSDPDPVDALHGAITLHDALARLPAPLRVVVVLKELEGFTHAEIAGMLGISVGASEVRLHRGMRALRRLISPIP